MWAHHIDGENAFVKLLFFEGEPFSRVLLDPSVQFQDNQGAHHLGGRKTRLRNNIIGMRFSAGDGLKYFPIGQRKISFIFFRGSRTDLSVVYRFFRPRFRFQSLSAWGNRFDRRLLQLRKNFFQNIIHVFNQLGALLDQAVGAARRCGIDGAGNRENLAPLFHGQFCRNERAETAGAASPADIRR